MNSSICIYLSKTESFDGHYHVVKLLEIMADIFRNDALGENFPFNCEVYPFTNMISSLISYMGISSACPFSQRKESSGFQCTMNQRKAHGWNSQQLLKVISSSDGCSCFTTTYINHTNLLVIILRAFLPLMF